MKESYAVLFPTKRVATIPTNNNLEDIVMRLLASTKSLSVEKLGLVPNILADLQKLMQRPYGLILVCGPTGSGKTTTLHSLAIWYCLRCIPIAHLKVWSDYWILAWTLLTLRMHYKRFLHNV